MFHEASTPTCERGKTHQNLVSIMKLSVFGKSWFFLHKTNGLLPVGMLGNQDYLEISCCVYEIEKNPKFYDENRPTLVIVLQLSGGSDCFLVSEQNSCSCVCWFDRMCATDSGKRLSRKTEKKSQLSKMEGNRGKRLAFLQKV